MPPEKTKALYARQFRRVYRPLVEDLLATAELAADFGAAFGAQEETRATGLWSDVGKASELWQTRLLAKSSVPVNHTNLGVWYASRQIGGSVGDAVAVAIAGHHGGLPNLRDLAALKRAGAAQQSALDDLPDAVLRAPKILPRSFVDDTHRFLFTQMIASAHIDADWQNAAEWERQQLRPNGTQTKPPPQPSLGELLVRLECAVPVAPNRRTEQLRAAFAASCVRNAECPPGFREFSVPARAVEPLGLLRYAVAHAHRHARSRVVLVYPTQAAIEQHADAVRAVIGDALVEPSAFDTRATGIKHRVERWDGVVILTTLRDLLGVLFDNRPASLRRLHRLVGAVIVVANAQQIPTALQELIRDVFRTLTTQFHTSVALVSTIRGTSEQFLGPVDVFDLGAALSRRISTGAIPIT